MSVQASLTAGREAARRLMTDTCRVTTAGGAPVYDAETNTSTPATATVLYEGACRVQQTAITSSVTVAVDAVGVRTYTVSIPVGAGDVERAATVTVLTSTFDPDLAGRVLRVRSVLHKSHATAQRIDCEVVE